jgi:DNA-binding HxlR family transcriptional regulator
MKKWASNEKTVLIEISETEQLNYCGVRTFLEILGGKWKFAIISLLYYEPMRYSEILKAIPLASEKMVLTSLRELESHKILERIFIQNSGPQKVEYQLTEYGKSIRPVLQKIENWGNQHIEIYPETVFYKVKKKKDPEMELV